MYLHWHKLNNYKKLLKHNKDENYEWRKKTNEGNGGKSKANNPNNIFNNRTKKAIVSAVDKWVTERMKALDQEKYEDKEVEAYTMRIIQKSLESRKPLSPAQPYLLLLLLSFL